MNLSTIFIALGAGLMGAFLVCYGWSTGYEGSFKGASAYALAGGVGWLGLGLVLAHQSDLQRRTAQ